MVKNIWRSFDLPLLLIVMVILTLGIVLVHSATHSTDGELPWIEQSAVKQALFAATGLVILLLAASVDYQLITSFPWVIYAVALGIMALVSLFGRIGFGSRSWLTLGGNIQPSELVKVLVILFLSKFLADREKEMGQLVTIVLALFVVVPPIALIYRQPDFGMALVLSLTCLGIILAAGVRLGHLVILGGGAVAIAPLVWYSLKDYMQQRILIFLNPGTDAVGLSYNTRQALISIGSGGWFGKGLLQGTQSQLYFLRVRHTDYIFSVLGEELGFLGAAGLLVLFAALLWRILRAATLAHDTCGRLIAAGVATMIFVQVFFNTAVNLNLVPTTGLTLPLVSYGGSSLWSTLLALGLVESVVMRHKRLEFSS